MVKMKRDDVPHNGYQNLYDGVEGAVRVEEVKDEPSTALVAATQNEIALYAARTFATQAVRTVSTAVNHKVKWFTGNNKTRDLNDRALPNITGLAIEVPGDECISPEDDALFEAMRCLCDQDRAFEVTVTHGTGNKVRYWSLPVASLFVVALGCPDASEMLGKFDGRRPSVAEQLARIEVTRGGVAYGWPEGFDEGGKPKTSRLSFVAFIKELMEAEEVLAGGGVVAHPYNAPFVFRLQSHCTDKMIRTLRSHYRVLEYGDRKRSEPGPYYGCALRMGCSREPKVVGQAPDTSEVYYPVPLAPRRITDEYLASVVISDDLAEIVEYDGRVDAAIEWSIEKSRHIIRGIDADIDDALGGTASGDTPEYAKPPY